MIKKVNEVLMETMQYDTGDAKRIQHLIKVYEFAKLIGTMEKLDEKTQYTLELAAIVHDIGIHKAEEKYGVSSGKYQELEGPEEARQILSKLKIEDDIIERVCYLVGHHHTYTDIDGIDYQILVEADFLVNIFEDDIDDNGKKTAYNKIFRTESGKKLFRIIYGE